MDNEIDISKCKICGKLKVRKQDGYFPSGRNKRFVDMDGKQWCGRKCPDCVRISAKTHIKQKRDDKKNEEV